MAINGTATADRRILKAFYVQYTAILLIILSFMVGSMTSKIKKSAPASEPVVEMADQTVMRRISVVDLPWITPREAALNLDGTELNAVREILMNHDVDARIELFPPSSSDHGDLPEWLRDATEVVDRVGGYFIRNSVQREAFQFRIMSPGRTTGIRVSLFAPAKVEAR